MRVTRLILAGLTAFALSNLAFALEVARFEGGDGHLAIQADEASPWQMARHLDEIAGTSRLRTSPAGVTRIALPDAELFLCTNCEVELNVAKRQIQLLRGNARLAVAGGAKAEWRFIAGHHASICPADVELAVATRTDQPEIHVLRGAVRLTHDNKMIGKFAAPTADVLRKGDRKSVAVPEDRVDEWTHQLRNATSPRPTLGIGQLIARDAQSGNQVRLEIARYHVNVVLKQPVALVQIDQSFFNPYVGQQEGTFVFNLPPGASVSRFAMYVTHENLIEGELIDRKRADEVYTTIVRSRRDPAILEQIGDHLFRMRVFPIPARDTKRILLDFTVPLVAVHGQYRFDLPMMSDLKPIADFSLTGTIHPPVAAPSVCSPTFPNLEFATQENGTVSFQSRAKNVQPPPYFSLRYVAPNSSEPSVQSYTMPDKSMQYFTVTVPETMNAAAAEPIRPSDVLLVVDTSGQNRKLAKAQLAARTVLSGLSPQDRVQIGCVDVSWRPITAGWHPVGSPEIEAGLKKLDDQFALGGNDLETTLPQAMDLFKDSPEKCRRIVVYIGDGPSKMDETEVAVETSKKKPDDSARPTFFAVRTGCTAVGSDWLNRQVAQTKGRSFDLNEGADPIGDLFEWSLAELPSPPKIDSVAVSNTKPEDLLHDPFWPHGRELHLFGRRNPGDSLRIEIAVNGQPSRTMDLPITQRPGDETLFTGRLWAQQKLKAMLDDESTEITLGRAAVLRHCQEWSLMSPLTAFLVLETEQDYERWKIDRKVRHRYWMPAGSVTATPLGTPSLNSQNPFDQTAYDDAARAEVARVLDTVDRLVKRERHDLALHTLAQIREKAQYYDADRYNGLRQSVYEKLRPGDRLESLKLWRPVADRRVTELMPPACPLLLQFAHGGFSPEFLDGHPHARELLRVVRDYPTKLTLKQLPGFIQEITGVPVLLEERALDDEGIKLDMALDLENLENISVRSFLAEVLEPVACQCVPERHLLRITTQTQADELWTTHVYPVRDLVQSDTMPAPHRLANPYLDQEESTKRRIEARLKNVVSIDYSDFPLGLAMEAIGKEIGTRIRIDKQGLEDEGIKVDQEVSMKLANVPAGVALTELLKPLALTTVVENELLKVRTATIVNSKFKYRLFSAAGLVRSEPTAPRPKPNWGMGMGFGMGGFPGGGMLGGALGGGGGGEMPTAGPRLESGGGNDDSEFGFFVDPRDELSNDLNERSGQGPNAASDSKSRDNEDDADELIPAISPLLMPSSESQELSRTVENATSGGWANVDGDGGSTTYFPLSCTLVVRQSSTVHREMADVFKQLRSQLTGPFSIRRSKPTSNESQTIDFHSLQRVISESISVRWSDYSDYGGTPSLPAMSLTIRQTARGHEEIARLFTQLRRARYVAESLPYRTSLDGIDDLSLFDRPTLTELPRNAERARPVAKASEEKWLAVRHVPATMSQKWRSVSKVANQRREFSVRRGPTRLELVLPDRIVRADDLRAAVAYPGLKLVEIDGWGDSARQLADAVLPWMPHRSNEELSELFEITLVEETSRVVTLRLNFPGLADTYLQTTFSKLTRLPVKWMAVAANEPQFELRFDLKSVVAVDPKGNELERWELVADEAVKPILALHEGWRDSLVVDVAAPDTPYSKARELLRKGDYAGAMQQLGNALNEQPNQPLLNFLLAWCGEFAPGADAARQQLIRQSLERVAQSDAEDLIRLMTPLNFPSLGGEGLSSLLQSIPAERRSSETWYQLAELAYSANKPEQALLAINRALASPADLTTKTRRQILQIELLLKTLKVPEAEKAAKELNDADLTVSQLVALAHLFARFERHDYADTLFDRIVQRLQLKGSALGRLLEQQAEGFPKGRRRWQLLLSAATAFPATSENRERCIDRITSEALDNADAIVLGELASNSTVDSLRSSLRRRQADLLSDRKQAAQIVLEELEARRIPPELFLWGLQILREANESAHIIRLVESRLRKGQPQRPEVKHLLREAYANLDQHPAAHRAATDKNDPPSPNPQNRMPNGGGGFF